MSTTNGQAAHAVVIIPSARLALRAVILGILAYYAAFFKSMRVTLGEGGEASLDDFLSGFLHEKNESSLHAGKGRIGGRLLDSIHSSSGRKRQYNTSASGVYYPRPRRLFSELYDCGCPYTCTDAELDTVQSGQKQTCRQAAHNKMTTKKRIHGAPAFMGEEMACHTSEECSDNCNFMTCKRPPLEQVEIEPPAQFTRHEGVAIVTKIMGRIDDIDWLKQMLCLLTSAYNERMNYDIVVFSTIDQDNATIAEIQSIVEPAKFTLVYENVTVGGLINSMSPARRQFFLDNCIENHTQQFTWDSCPNVGDGKLAYNWQAEFRSLHIWTQPALAPYKYMLWIDADGFQTMRWDKDPVDFVIRNDLVLAALNMKGRSIPRLQEKIKDYFGYNVCKVVVDQNSSIYAETKVEGCGGRFDIVHGFFHIENLDFFRSNIKWMTKLIGENRLSRNPDDQEAITTAALLLAPGRTRDLHLSGIKLNMFHNGLIDGKRKVTPAQYLKWWELFSERDFPNGRDKCSKYIVAFGR